MQIFHLGYPKCGSTTIQDLLKADAAVNFLGKPYRTSSAEYYVREYLPFADLRQLPYSELQAMRAELCTGTPVISEELLSGIGFRHGVATNSLFQTLDNIELLTGGNFVACIILRRPMDFIRSYFGQLARMGAVISFDQFCSLALVRRHHWLMQALNYRALLGSKRARDGQLKVALFEQLFAGKGLEGYMRSTFGSQNLPDSPWAVGSNPSDTDSVLDAVAHHNPVNPANSLELQITRPSLQEHVWIDALPPADRDMHQRLWARERAVGVSLQNEAIANLTHARAALGNRRGRRPVSEPFRRLLAEVFAVNAGLAEDFPQLQLAEHGYFAMP